jgi:plasmid stabilization system protein ParE
MICDATSEDCRAIIRWSVEEFGPAQGRAYASVINATLEDLLAGRGTIEKAVTS